MVTAGQIACQGSGRVVGGGGFHASRIIDERLEELWAELPALSIAGARGVGKTTIARQMAGTFLDLDDAAVFEVLEADPRAVASFPPPVVVDEWQRLPVVFDAVRRAVDEDRSSGRFILTGSASPKQPPTTRVQAGS